MNNTIILNDIDLVYLLKAEKNFKQTLTRLGDDQLKMGAVQAFQICHELCWKIVKKVVIKLSTIQPQYSRDVYREAAKIGIIDNPESWFNFIVLRNQTVHTYLDDVLDEVIAKLPIFQKEAEKLIHNLQKLK